MGISFLGHTPDYNFWVFNIDGKTFLARNNSTQSPLRLNFKEGRFFGNYSIDKIIPGAVLVKNSGFDIISGTSQVIGNTAGMVMSGIVEWTWAGQKYRNRWTLTEGLELSPAIPEEGVEGTYAYDLDIQPPYTPYDGPAGGAVGTGVTSQSTIVAAKTKDEREALEAATAQISPSAQLSTAAPEQASPAPAKPVTAGVVSNAAIAQSNKTKEDLEASTAYKTPGYTQPVYASQVRPPATYTPASTGMTRMTTSPVIIPGTKDAREAAEAAAAAGTDWVKLSLQIGAAYLLFS
jgi:hypothetical protein